ncbi:MAG: hypothetical protein LLH30_05005 [Candidatus Manganitrophus sp. SA1]|nr:hypothetical protein [Candidatus Manganitrophus morganii]
MLEGTDPAPKRRLLLKEPTGLFLRFLLPFFLIGCAASFLHYYDPTTYKNLTDLKPKVAMLYETFEEEAIDLEAVRQIRLEMGQAYEYEKGKGEKNRETARQIGLILEMFSRHVQEWKNKGKWSEAQIQNRWENMEEAFDIAISTERLKNKNE